MAFHVGVLYIHKINRTSNNTSNHTLNHNDSHAHISHKYLKMNNIALNANINILFERNKESSVSFFVHADRPVPLHWIHTSP